jgi:adenosylcobinamide-phosphate synthase
MGILCLAILGTCGLAQRSLFDHVQNVYLALAHEDLSLARKAVGMIVGRDTASLDETAIAAAALESLAESFCDGVVAPVFWFFIGGLGGLIAFKAVSTADSMIGHKEMPWRDFGWASARCDDLMNWVPARLSGALITMACGRGWAVMMRDAAKHLSPPAGWPEAAMAGALGISLGGDAYYDGERIARAQFGSGPRPSAQNLLHGLYLYRRACGLLWLLVAVIGVLWPL